MALDWPGLGGNPAAAEVRSFDDIVRWAADRIDGPSVLVGQSMGGFVAMRIAIEHPELVSRLVMTVTSAGVDRQRLGLPDWRITPDDTEPEWVGEPQRPLDDLIPTVTVPTLLLWATDDVISPLPLAHRLQELLPDASLVVYPSSDHWFVLDHVSEVADEIANFIGQPPKAA